VNKPDELPPEKKEPSPTGNIRKFAAVAVVIVLAGVTVLLFSSVRRKLKDKRPQSFDIVPLTTLSGNTSGGSFSPDGSQIAFVYGDNAAPCSWGDIYVKTLDDERMLRLTSDGKSSCPVWSPDGAHIAYEHMGQTKNGDPDWGIYLISPLGGGSRKIKDTPAGACEMDWSPDGTLIVYKDEPPGQSAGLFLMSSSGSPVRRLTTSDPGFDDRFPAFSRDGKRVAFVRNKSWGSSDIFVVDVSGGEPRRLTFMNDDLGRPVWTSDNEKIVFWACTGGSWWAQDLYVVPVSGGKPERLPFSNYDAAGPAISRRGDKLSYMRCTFDINIWKRPISNSTEPASKFAASSSRRDLDPEYSPDGSKVAFMSDRSGQMAIWLTDADGSNATMIAAAWGGTSPRWSPDGTQITFDSRLEGPAHIMVVGVEGGQPKRLTDGDFEEIVPSWSSDGQWIYFGSMRSGVWEIWKASPATKQTVQVTFRGGHLAQATSDGQFVYYAKPLDPSDLIWSSQKPGIWRVATSGGPEELVTDEIRERIWHATPEGIYFPDNESKPHPLMKYFEFATRHVKTIGELTRRPGDHLILLYRQITAPSSIHSLMAGTVTSTWSRTAPGSRLLCPAACFAN